jgi:cytochrome b pre-mRNA-processing protein 3
MILGLFRKHPNRRLVEATYERLVEAARHRSLYERLGVPDTIEGRFESVALHLVLVLRALRRLPKPADEVAQELVDGFFRHMDASMRETGVGDMAVPKRMKKLAAGFYGRARAYDQALDAGDAEGLAQALHSHLHGEGRGSSGLARYALAAERRLAAATLDGLLAGGPNFPAPDDVTEETAP